MSTKAQELKMAAEGRGCLGRSKDDEPVFVLCGRDPFAPIAIEEWCSAIERSPPGGKLSDRDRAKIKEAREQADAMRNWLDTNKPPQMPDNPNISLNREHAVGPVDRPFTSDRKSDDE